MLETAQYRNIPLPKGWPRRVRSAVIQVISLAHFSLTHTRSWAANHFNVLIRLKQENGRLRQELALLREETRIKDVRMELIPAHRRPHYPPIERMAILELRAARGWSLSQTAKRFLVSPATVASWMSRLDDEGSDALVQIKRPVNKFPDFVRYIVRRLKVLCPAMGGVKIAQVLCRAGLHLGSTTVRRMLRDSPGRAPISAASPSPRFVRANSPNQIWHLDLTTVPTSLGFWTAWLPFALPQCWPFCWWVALVVDHYSRRAVGFAVFEQQPDSAAIRAFLGSTIRKASAAPRHLITDQGMQFRCRGFLRWCRRRKILQRFGAIGKYGSVAVIERFIRTMKVECTRQLLAPFHRDVFRRELSLFATWYNGDRPHTRLEVRTPDEVYYGLPAACLAPRCEPRRRWPRDAPCAAPQTTVRGRRGTRLELHVGYRSKRKHLPIVELKRAA